MSRIMTKKQSLVHVAGVLLGLLIFLSTNSEFAALIPTWALPYVHLLLAVGAYFGVTKIPSSGSQSASANPNAIQPLK